MKYSLMSLMLDSELKHQAPNLIHVAMLHSVGVREIPSTAEACCALLNERGIPMREGSAGFEDLVRFTAENGFDGLDMTSFELELEGSEHKAILERYGVKLSAVNIIMPFSEATTEAEYQEMLEATKRDIDKAVDCGADKILLVPGGYGRAEGGTREMAFETMTRALGDALAYAAGRIAISTEPLENIGLPWSSLGEMARVLDAVPGLGYNHDTGNPLVANEDPLEILKRFRDRILNVHFKDLGPAEAAPGNYRCMDGSWLKPVPLGTGLVDFRAQLRALREMGYQGFINLEGGRPAPDKWQEAVEALHWFRALEKEL